MVAVVILWFLVLLVIVVKVSIKINERRKYANLLNKIPGPPSKPIVGNLLDAFRSREKVWLWLRQNAKSYYPIYRTQIGPLTVVNMFTPDEIETVLSSSINIKKGYVYKIFLNWLGDGPLTATGSTWHKQRKSVISALHLNTEVLKIFTRETEILVQELKSECTKPAVDPEPIVSATVLKILVETVMRVQLDTGNNSKQFIKNIHRICDIISSRIHQPWRLIDQVYMLSGEYKKEMDTVERLHNFAKNIITNRINAFQARRDDEKSSEDRHFRRNTSLIDILINSMMKGDNVNENTILEVTSGALFAGFETSASSLCCTLMLLASHQKIQEKAREEIYSIFGNSKRHPTIQDIQQLQYLDMIIKESLRLYPSIPLISRNLTEPITTKSGYYIPEGVDIAIHILDLHLNENIWPNPMVFDPDRFLPNNISRRHPFAYLPFSAGPRNCIGQKFSMMEMKVILLGILRNFILIAVDTPETIVPMYDIVNRTKERIKVKFEKL